MSNPLVSFICSTYNDSPTLAKSLSSILNQNYANIEVVIVNDGSTDSTPLILNQLQKEASASRLKVVHSKNQGLTKSLNLAFAHAQGEFIARHDLDDHSPPDRISTQYQSLIRHNLDFVISRSYINGTSRIAPNLAHRLPPKIILPFVNYITHGTFFLHRDLFLSLRGYNESYTYSQDYDFLFRAFKSQARIGITRKPLYIRYLHSNSISSRNSLPQAYFAKLVQSRWQRFFMASPSSFFQTLKWIP